MKKYFFPIALIVLLLAACNNSDTTSVTTTIENKADSLYDDVMQGHNEGMAKMSRISKAKKEVNRLLDSVAALPAAAKQASISVKNRLDSLLSDLNEAETSMNSWMEKMNWDSAKNNIEARVKYLTEEKLEVNKVKQSILTSLQKADSVLKSKF